MARLLEPVKLKNSTIKNRLVLPPMATGKADDQGYVTPSIHDYYAEKTRGGYFGLVITEHAFVSPEGKASKNQMSVAHDSVNESLSSLAKMIHSSGSKALVQISHAGGKALREHTGFAPVAPSAVPIPKPVLPGIARQNREYELPHELTRPEIEKTVEAFAAAAARVKLAGFDGVELHAAHGYLLNQFFSPLTNRRTDEYGGSVLNRARIICDIIKAVRKAAGPEFMISLRLGACDYTEGGTTLDDSIAVALSFESAGIDLLHISGGMNGYAIPGVNAQGYFSELSKGIKKVVTVPVILTGGVTEPDAAERLLKDKKADMIGVGRAVLADSNWAKHAVERFNKMS